jgi:hypothetical protein
MSPTCWKLKNGLSCLPRGWRENSNSYLQPTWMAGNKIGGKFKLFLLVSDVDARKDFVRYVPTVAGHLHHARQHNLASELNIVYSVFAHCKIINLLEEKSFFNHFYCQVCLIYYLSCLTSFREYCIN